MQTNTPPPLLQLQRDLWFKFPPPNASLLDIPCTLHTTAFVAFLWLFTVAYGMAIFLSFVAAAFQKKAIARAHLLLVNLHACAGLALCVGTIVRDDFHSMGNPGFWVCWAMLAALTLAHSLLLTDTLKNLSTKTLPIHLTPQDPIYIRLTQSSALQQCALGFAGVETVLCFITFLLIIPGDFHIERYWDEERVFFFRKEFLWMLGVVFAGCTTLTFISVPVQHTYRMWQFCKETREHMKRIVAADNAISSSRRNLGLIRKPDEVLNPLTEEDDENKSEMFAGGGRGHHNNARSSGLKKKNSMDPDSSKESSSQHGSPLHTLTKSMSQTFKSVISRESLTDDGSSPTNRIRKRRPTLIENQRKSMLEFQHKMLTGTILGCILSVIAVVLCILICENRVLGPVAPAMIFVITFPWFLEFTVIHLYFPESILHEKFVKLLPVWLQERIDGVDCPSDDDIMAIIAKPPTPSSRKSQPLNVLAVVAASEPPEL